MLTQKAMLRIAEIKGWTIVRSSASTLDFDAGKAYALFTFEEHPTFKCQVAFSQTQVFQDRINKLCTKEER